NVQHPRYLVITLTDVCPISQAVRYPVDDLAEISDAQLDEALVVAIQPRTEEPALLSESHSIKLNQRIRELTNNLLSQYNLQESSLVFYATGRSTNRLSHVAYDFCTASSLFI